MRPIILLPGLVLFVAIVIPIITGQPLADVDANAGPGAAADAFVGIFGDIFKAFKGTAVHEI